MSKDYNKIFVIPMKLKWKPFRRCDECGEKKFSVHSYIVYDASLIHAIKNYYVCKKCLKEARERVKNEDI